MKSLTLNRRSLEWGQSDPVEFYGFKFLLLDQLSKAFKLFQPLNAVFSLFLSTKSEILKIQDRGCL